MNSLFISIAYLLAALMHHIAHVRKLVRCFRLVLLLFSNIAVSLLSLSTTSK